MRTAQRVDRRRRPDIRRGNGKQNGRSPGTGQAWSMATTASKGVEEEEEEGEGYSYWPSPILDAISCDHHGASVSSPPSLLPTCTASRLPSLKPSHALLELLIYPSQVELLSNNPNIVTWRSRDGKHGQTWYPCQRAGAPYVSGPRHQNTEECPARPFEPSESVRLLAELLSLSVCHRPHACAVGIFPSIALVLYPHLLSLPTTDSGHIIQV